MRAPPAPRICSPAKCRPRGMSVGTLRTGMPSSGGAAEIEGEEHELVASQDPNLPKAAAGGQLLKPANLAWTAAGPTLAQLCAKRPERSWGTAWVWAFSVLAGDGDRERAIARERCSTQPEHPWCCTTLDRRFTTPIRTRPIRVRVRTAPHPLGHDDAV